jgi:carbon-monoxide dehydrogenase iron sulfur subunit
MKGMIVVNVERCVGCKRCRIECAVAHSQSKDLLEAIREQPRPVPRVTVEAVEQYSAPLQCRHCEDAPCVLVCPSGAIKQQSKGFPVLVEERLCIGCKSCIMACPFGVVRVGPGGKAIVKCDLCVERLAKGQQPACVTACHVHALEFKTPEEVAAQKRRKTAREYLVILKG